jgi:hypothetical protein
MNLSPIKYARVLSESGGPIDRIEMAEIKLGGVLHYTANAWLSEDLHLSTGQQEVFSEAGGSGTDRYRSVAQYKAISEALERWCYHYLMQIGHTRAYGFNLDGSTSGMAAYPGLFAFQARRRAKLEAEERFCVKHWWLGYLDSVTESLGDCHAVYLENPISASTVALTWRSFADGRWGYGTAAANRAKAAVEGARIEMERSIAALERHGPADRESVDRMDNYGERQMLYYSIPEGHAAFMERLEGRPFRGGGMQPEKVIDRIIPGPWQKYATVWRVLYQANFPKSPDSGARGFLY